MSAEIAVNILWAAWYLTWIAAVVFSARTKAQMRTGGPVWHRIAASIGVACLFFPARSGRPVSGLEFVGPATQKLWQEPAWAAWSLFGLVVTAFGFCWWARLHLGRLWSGFVTLKEGHRVVESGPYGLVRHPIYSGVIAAALATAAIRASPLALLGALLITLGFSMTARIEERFLRNQLGADAYDGYSRRVGMLIPGVG
jgi:protein-S-isoprenylcysteine O-methyltransferase Ste14